MKALIFCDDLRVDEVASLCQAKKCGIEVQSFYDPELIRREPDALAVHRRAIMPIELRALHGPFGDLCAGSFDPMVREVAANRFELAYQLAMQLDVTHIILHHGYVPGTSSSQGWLSRFVAFWQAFLEAKTDKIAFHIENMLEHDPVLLSDVIAAIGRANVDVCLDIGHVHCNAKTSVLYWIEQMGDQIGYVHMHDNHGKADEHLGLGEGTIPMIEVCNALLEYAPEAIWAIEARFSYLESSYRWLVEYGFLSL